MLKYILRMQLICSAVATCAALPAMAAESVATFQPLGDLPGGTFNSHAFGVSDNGAVIVGSGVSTRGREAFRWTSSTWSQGLGDLPGGSFESWGYEISGDGSTIVGGGYSGLSSNEAFRWTSATGMQGLGDLPGGADFSTAFAVSGDGAVIIGRGHSAAGAQAFRWTSSTGMQGLGEFPGGSFSSFALGISGDGSIVVGDSESASGLEAFRWTSTDGMQGLGDLPGGTFFSKARAISADGFTIVGGSNSASGGEAFRWTGAEGMQGLGDLPGGSFASFARAVSGDGSIIVGEGRTASAPFEAFIWSRGDGMGRLADVLQNDYGVSLAGVFLVRANDISADSRTIVGEGWNASGQLEAWMATLPEPPAPFWNVNSDGNWHDSSNWGFPLLPNGVDAEARLTRAITSSRAVLANAPVTLGRLRFDNSNSYLLAGDGLLTLEVTSGSALLEVRQGSHVVSLPLVIASNTELKVSSGALLNISNAITGPGTLTKTGTGILMVQRLIDAGAVVTAGTVVLTPNGGTDGVSRLTSLQIDDGGTLSTTDNDLLVDYTSASPEAQIRQWVKDGINTGFGITTSQTPEENTVLAIADNAEWGKSHYNGVTIDLTTIIGKYTYFGDANLDGKVTGDDYVAVDSNLGIGDSWIEGDFNMDGRVSGDDYVAIDANLGKGTLDPLSYSDLKAEMVALHVEMFGQDYLTMLAAAEAEGFAVVPEPAGGAAVGLLAAWGMRRRRTRP